MSSSESTKFPLVVAENEESVDAPIVTFKFPFFPSSLSLRDSGSGLADRVTGHAHMTRMGEVNMGICKSSDVDGEKNEGVIEQFRGTSQDTMQIEWILSVENDKARLIKVEQNHTLRHRVSGGK